MTSASFYRSSLRFLTLMLIAALGLVKTGCDYSMVEEPVVIPALKISITPQTAEMQKGMTLDLSAVISGYKSNGNVTWEFAGPAAGELKANGLTAKYTAPANLAVSPTVVSIRVRSVEDTSRYATSTLTILDTVTNGGGGGQITLMITPLSVTLEPGKTQQFDVTVMGSTNAGVTWRMVSGPGTISSDGLYAAPSSITTTETAVIEAASVADPSKTTRATITIKQAIDPNLVCFERDVKPIFISNCTMSGCHSGPNPQEGLDFTTYNGIVASDNLHEILEKITESDPDDIMPPPPHDPLTAEQIATIRKWIQQGAKNTDCTVTGGGDCDTLNVSFANTINPLIQNTCVGCHSNSNPGKGLNFTTHAGVRAAAQSGQLYGALSHAQGFTAMPQGMDKLDDCTLAKIKSWINAGAPNN